MGFLSVCTAIYDYQAQAEGELEIKEGDLLFILEKSDDTDWWKAKKRAAADDEDEPVGLIPNNYVEESKPTHSARALYDYTRQTEEEVTFTDNATLEVFDTSDPDWTLVGFCGEYGFAPANYIEIVETQDHEAPPVIPSRPVPAASTAPDYEDSPTTASPTSSLQGPAANLARVLGGGAPASPMAARPISASTSTVPRLQFTPEASDGEADEPAPALPARPLSQSLSPSTAQYTSPIDDEPAGVLTSLPYNRAISRSIDDEATISSPGGYHLYNINEMVSSMGKRKKMPTTLGLNLATGSIMLSPAKSRDGPSQEWTAEKMTHYSIEGKHVFIELIRPSKSLDLHAGAKDTAKEIVSALGEIAGAFRGAGIKEILRAATGGGGGQKAGLVLYDFMAQGDDEVTVAVGDEVVVLDDIKSEEWWMVRRLKNGEQGVVPSSYIEIKSTTASEPSSRSGINAGKSTVEQNRLEEERLAKEATRAHRDRGNSASGAGGIEVGPGMRLPQRGSSLAGDEESRASLQRDRRSSRAEAKSSKPKPDPKKMRMWTDRSGSFRVEAQFIGLTDGKIHLHKHNGVKIAVPTSKMAVEDLEYVEQATGVSLDDDKPLESLRHKKRVAAETRNGAGATIEPPKPPQYDWFDFFLKAGVGPHQCDRYSQSMNRDSVDESDLPEVTQETLRRLGLKEGDILKVMKFLDNKFGRTRNVSLGDGLNGDPAKSNGGLFTGADGTLQNNTRRGRPDSNRQSSDVVDAKLLEQREESAKQPPAESRATPLTNAPEREKVQGGFDDDAWVVKPAKQAAAAAVTSIPAQAPLSGALADLSLLSPPLQPTIAIPQQTAQALQPQQTAPAPTQQQQLLGANPGFFSQLNPQQTGLSTPGGFAQTPHAGGPQQLSELNPPRQRPQAPQQGYNAGSLLPPPPRPLSAPQNVQQQSQFGVRPLQPQLTGIPQNAPPQAPPGYSLNELNQQRFQQQYGQSQLQPQATGYPQQTPGMPPFATGLQPQQTAFQYPNQQFTNFQQQQQPQINGNAIGSPFADPRPSYQSTLSTQPAGYVGLPQQGPLAGGINSVLPPALQPQPTGFQQPQQTGFPQPQQNGYLQSQPTNYQQPQQNGLLQTQQTGFQQSQPTGFQQPQLTGFGQPPQQNGFGNANFQAPPLPPIPQQPTIAPLQPQRTGPAPPVKFGTPAPKLTPQPTGRRANLSHATPQNPFGF